MDNNTIYWLWLTLKDELKTPQITVLLQKYKNAGEIYHATDFDDLHGLSDDVIKALADKSLLKANEVKNRIANIGGYIVTIEDEDYPKLLKNIYNPPYVLYMSGKHMDWDSLLTLTVVGTRSYNDYGRRATEYIVKDLSESGVTIVSGMARGIDSIAAIASINCGGQTVAVLGSGLDVIYPPEHVGLYNEIRQKGVVMTEYPPGTRPLRENFPRRNRIMAGLSYGVLVTQAPKKSGALITASYALENGRDVFAVPADIFMGESEGSNRLISQGAKAVMSAEDILNEYSYFEFARQNDSQKTDKSGESHDLYKDRAKNKTDNIDFDSLNNVQTQIIKCLANAPYHVDDLSREIGVQSFETDRELVMLELMGIVRKLNSNIYELL